MAKCRLISNRKGFTLVEVLIALTILSLVLTSAFLVISEGIKTTAQLEKKLYAGLAATEVLNRVLSSRWSLPPLAPEIMKGEVTIADQTFNFHAFRETTDYEKIEKINVLILKNKKPLDELEGLYILEKK